MHDIEPFYNWREFYAAEEDQDSPFYGKEYDEFYFTNRVYNYYIHPQWDAFGSDTLYMKILYADYDQGFCIIEMIGEWNDCLHNDIMFFKRKILDALMIKGIYKFAIIGENVFNFHGGDDCYYEEWYESVYDENGWIIFLNLFQHVYEEMRKVNIHHYVNLLPHLMNFEWRKHEPQYLYKTFEALINKNKFIESE
ncbi:hypothetical protein [Membranihabitans maritimus]|uniref:hypothetical protein n=1 Tax=Membranihabitans maritimus TaxID=2904244 RepID=UPI001F470C3E|nr:hypothetical protein [Membranihabitans maritimus]